uniref:ATP-dependent Clp protease proteolytic subunit n=1 Tax=Guaiacum angustifolium TaxID=228647 RepID=A0A4Y5PQ31_9ROSI|nr:clp protease proteolytic subunit [Guaiacum angustifolium]QCW94094.1 clp protease proteolytic subunit [Guaiacum angustifolium]
MPVGVPKVPFRIPGEEDASWVDLYNRLYRQRLLFLGQEVDDEVSNQLIGLMVYLSLEDSTINQYLFINSPGGLILPGIGIVDTMQTVIPEVQTVCIGSAISTGCFILVGGEITKRMAFPHARVMIHQPAISFLEAPLGEMIMEGEEVLHLYEIVTRTYVQRTGKPLWVIIEDMKRDVFMSAEEAQDHGIIDLISQE